MSAREKIEPRLVEVTSVPVIYADGPAKVVIEGSNARVTFFEYRTFGTERVRMPVLEMIRPIATINGSLPRLIEIEARRGEQPGSTH